MKKLFRVLFVLLMLVALYFVSGVLLASLTNYQPTEEEVLSDFEVPMIVSDTNIYSAMIWNIGYAGLGAEMDFFYDGGVRVRSDEDNVRRNLREITRFLGKNDTLDFILLQEVDQSSKRSYKINQIENFNLQFDDYFPFYAANYKVKFIPVPVFRPLGSVHSGLLTLTRHIPQTSTRLSLPGQYAWPKGIFMLNRCLLVNRFQLPDGKQLVLVNLHNSAYDDGSQRSEQLKFIRQFVVDEYINGNYVIAGGDWNQCPPEIKPDELSYKFDSIDFSVIPANLFDDDWQWIFNNHVPTNRRLQQPYERGKSLVTIIDFFLVSPNIEICSYETVNLDFSYSDHNPVLISFKFKDRL